MDNFNDQVELLLQDDRLVKWVLNPDEETIAYWEKWMQENPDGVTALFKAREIAHDLAYTEKPADATQLADTIWSGIMSDLKQQTPANLTEEAEETVPIHRWRLAGWLAAASLTGLLALAAVKYYKPASPTAPIEGKVANLLFRDDLDRVNQTGRSQVVYLVDGSKVTLQPGAGIRHATFLRKDKREIYLAGNAFFEVAKDDHRPFYVYSGNLIVRVLGTSFNVSTDKSSGNVTVLVRTGKVAVSQATSPLLKPLILLPNQMALYKGQSGDLLQTEADKKDLIASPAPAMAVNFNFEETPVIKVFQTLEAAYGVPFHYDAKTFSHCVITTTLADEPLEQKIKIICEAIGARYEIKDNGVFLDGEPCKE